MTMGWKERFKEWNLGNVKDPETMMEDFITPGEKDVGLYSKDHPSSVYITKTGAISAFCKEGLGIKIDPDTDSISLYASKINLCGNLIDMYSAPFGVRWNKFPMNLKPVAAPGEGLLLPYTTIATDIARYIGKLLGVM